MLLKLFRLVEKNDTFSGKLFDRIIVSLIVINVIGVVLQSYNEIYKAYKPVFEFVEFWSVAIFTVEYLLRLLVSPFRYSNIYHPKYILKYVFSFSSFIDLLAILPFYLPLLFAFDLRVLRIVRLFRLLRVLKLTRYVKALELIILVFKKKRAELIMSSFFLTIVVFFSGTLMYFSENEVQPNSFPNIVESTAWSIKTMIFLGYDGPSPKTDIGNVFGMLTVLMGLGWITLPISILSSGFIETVGEKDSGNGMKKS